MVNGQDLIRISALTTLAFVLAMMLTPILTHFLYKYKLWQKIREESWDGQSAEIYRSLHKKKEGTPRMGGLLIWVTAAALTLLFNWSRSQTYLPVFIMVMAGLLGLVDDILNIRGTSAVKGMSTKLKFFFQFGIAGFGAWWFFSKLGYSEVLIPAGPVLGLPAMIDVGWLYLPLFVLVVVFVMNAVNITDGLDGLAGGLLAAAFGALMTIAWVQGQYGLAVFCGTLIGAILAFLWFNIYPARFFMGDTGAFALGATLAVVSFLTNTVIILPIIGLLFVVEAMSSLIQRFSKKYFHRKIFISAPLHHHFEALGWPETKVTMRFWIIAVVCAVIGMVAQLLGRSIV